MTRNDGKVIADGKVYDDVCDAIEPTPEAAAVARACSNLMDATVARIRSWDLTQREEPSGFAPSSPG